MMIADVAGVLLAGGKSSRFGSNKALALFQGRPLVSHAAALLQRLFGEILLVTNSPAEYAFLGWPMTGDIFPDCGPLAGIHAALGQVASPRIFVVGCDMPLVQEGLVRLLCGEAGRWQAVVPALDQGLEPLCALYSKECLPVIEENLRQGRRQLHRLFGQVRTKRIAEPVLRQADPSLVSFENINRLPDLKALAALLPSGLATPITGKNAMPDQLDLDQARRLIVSHCPVLATEEIPLVEACGRTCGATLTAELPIPHFRQSAMDGFALRRQDCAPGRQLPIISEIAAGSTREHVVDRHTAIRIMTGGRVPQPCDQVVPFEECREENGMLSTLRLPGPSHIRKVGTDVKKGHRLIQAGEVITPGHMHLAATAGAQTIRVHGRPKAAIICTGSELVDDNPLPGQVISGNRFLLAGLITQAGGLISAAATVRDDITAIAQSLAAMAGDADLVITTGGMGPGKYDLVAQALQQLGVTIHYRALRLRPGKATLFGTKDATLFFGLPGPPPAVRLLFHELVHPALLALQGRGKPGPKSLRAELSEELAIKQKGLLNLKGGILTLANGRCQVRPAHRHEAASCIILVPAHRRRLKKGELVTIHLTEW